MRDIAVVKKLLVILVLLGGVSFAQNDSSSSNMTALDKLSGLEIMKTFREQVEPLRLRAKYTVYEEMPDKKVRTEASSVRDGMKYHVHGTAYISDKVIEYREIYDGVFVTRYTYSRGDKVRNAHVFPGKMNAMLSSPNSLFYYSGLDGIVRSFIRNPDRTYTNMGYEMAGGHNCVKLCGVSPYLEGKEAYTYRWITRKGNNYLQVKTNCLIDNDPEQMLYEDVNVYSPDNDDFLPWEVHSKRRTIDSKGKCSPYSYKKVVVDEIELVANIEDSEFRYIFPEDTVVRNVGISEEELKAFLSPDYTGEESLPKHEKIETAEPVEAKKQFKIAGGDGPILVPVRFGKEEYTFMLDTGTSITIFDMSLRKYLGPRQDTIGGETPSRKMIADVFEAPSAYLGPFNLQGIGKVVCIDLNMVSLVLGEKIGGIIGMNFLKNHVVQMDFDQGILEFDPGRAVSLADWGQEYSIRYNMGVPEIKAKINDEIELDFILDTGAGSTGDLSKQVFDAILKKKPDTPTSEVLSATASGAMKSREMRVSNLLLGENQYKGLIMGESDQPNLGIGFMSRYKVTFDFPNGKVYFKKGKDFNKVDETDMSGLYLSRMDNETKVYDVGDNSPADKTQIRSGDIVLKINGKDAGQYGMMDIRRLLKSGDGKEIKLVVKRDEKQMEVCFKLRKEI